MASRRHNKFALINDDDDTSSSGSTQSGPSRPAGQGKKRAARALPQVTQHLDGGGRRAKQGVERRVAAAASSARTDEATGHVDDPAAAAAAHAAFVASKFSNPRDAREFEMLKKQRDKYDAREMETKKSFTDAAMQGTCTGMCSRFEFLQRIFFDQIDSFERTNGFPDMTKAVKKFQRSSAGNVQHPDDLRTIDALMATTEYLFSLIRDHGLDKSYQFVWDRLRAIRRDASTQSLRGPQVIQIYEQVVRFHLVCFLTNPVGMNWIQDVDLLNATLTELLYLYTLTPSTPNEFEFRCYDALLYCGDPQRRHRLCEYAASLTATDPTFASSPDLVALWRATRKLNRLLGISTHSTADAPTQFGAHDFSSCANVMSRAPLGVAAITALHLDRLRRDALFDLARAKYSIHDRLVTVISIEDIVEKLKFASVEEAITFFEVFGVAVRAETDAAGVDSVVVDLDTSEWKDAAVDLKKPAKTKMAPTWFLNKVERIDLIEFIRTGTAIEMADGLGQQQQRLSGGFAAGSVGVGGFQQQQQPFGAAAAPLSFALSSTKSNGSNPFSAFAPPAPSAKTFPTPFSFPAAQQQSSPQQPMLTQQQQQQHHTPNVSFNSPNLTNQPAATQPAPQSSPFTFQPANPTAAQSAPPPVPVAPFIAPTGLSASTALTPASTPALPAFALPSTSPAFSFPSAPAANGIPSIPAVAPVTATPPAFTPPRSTAPTSPSQSPAPVPAPSPAPFSFGPAAPAASPAPVPSAPARNVGASSPVVAAPPPPLPAPPKVMVTAACVQTDDLDLPSISSSDSEPDEPRSFELPPPPAPPLEIITLADLAASQHATATATSHASSKRSRRSSSSSSATHRRSSPPARPLIETANKRPRWMGPSPAERAADARAAAFSLQRVQRAVLRTWLVNVELHRAAVAQQVTPQAALFADSVLELDPNKRYRILGLGTALVNHWHDVTWAEVVKGIARWQGVARATYRPWMVIAAGNHAVQCTRDWLGVVAKLVALGASESRKTRAVRVKVADVLRAERQVRESVHDLVPTSPIASPEAVDARSLCIRMLKSTVLAFVDAQFGEAADEFDGDVGEVVGRVDKLPLYNLTIPFHDVLVPVLGLASQRVVREHLGGLVSELDERAVLTGEQIGAIRDKVKAVTVEYLTFVYASMDAVRGHLAS